MGMGSIGVATMGRGVAESPQCSGSPDFSLRVK